MIRKFGYEIDIAEDGKVAIEKLNEKEYKLMFMNIQMSHKDRITVTKEIISTDDPNKETPIVRNTAHAAEGD